MVDEDEKVAVENGKGEEEATPEVVAAPENGTTEAEPEVTSTPAEGTDAVADDAAAKNGDYTGNILFHFISFSFFVFSFVN